MTTKKKSPGTPKENKMPPHPAVSLKSKPTSSHWPVLILLGLLITVVSIIRFNLAGMPLERDEGEYAYMGQLILNGVQPYATAYNMKLPGTYYMYAVIMFLFGESFKGIHIGLAVMNAGTMILLFLAIKNLFNHRIGLFAAGIYGLMALSIYVLGLAAHATHFVVFFLVAALFFFSRYSQRKRMPDLFLSALMMGLSFLMKQHAASFLLFGGLLLLAYEILDTGRPPGKQSIRLTGIRLLIYSAGVLLPYAILVGHMKAIGSFDKFWFWTVSYASQYTSMITWEAGKVYLSLSLLPMLKEHPWVSGLAVAGLLLVFFSGYSLRQKIFAVTFFFFSCLAVTPGFQFRQHYFVMMLPAIAILSGIAVDAALLRVERKVAWKGLPVVCMTAVLLVIYSLTLTGKETYYFAANPVRLTKSIYGTNPNVECVEIARYIREHSAPSDKIGVLGSEPEIFFYAGRTSATGYIYTYNMVELQDYNKRMQEEMIAEIEKNKPLYIVYLNVKLSWLTRKGAPNLIFEWAEKYCMTKYDIVGLVDIPDKGFGESYWNPGSIGNPASKNHIWIFKRKGGIAGT